MGKIVVILLTLLIGGGLSLLLLLGKGAFLIAGYNTAPEEVKKRYDEKKLCRATGAYLGLITVLVLGAEILGENIPGWYSFLVLAVVFLSIIPFLFYTNLGCKVKTGADGEGKEEKTQTRKEKKTLTWTSILLGLFSVAVLTGSGLILFTGEVKVEILNDQMEIQGSFCRDYEIPLSQIQSVAYREDFQTGGKKRGVDSPRLNAGTFKNKEFETYQIYSYAKCRAFVVMETDQGGLAVNGKTPEETKALYEKIKDAVEP